jgi:hypothetical protein
MANNTTLPTTVMIGGRTRAELLKDLRSADVSLNELAIELFSDPRFDTEPGQRPVPIRALTVHELGHSRGATWSELMQSSIVAGLRTAPLELAPHLRLQCAMQPEGAIGFPASEHCAPHGSITVASETTSPDDDQPKGFYLRTIDGTPWLRAYRSHAAHVWNPADVLLFVIQNE